MAVSYTHLDVYKRQAMLYSDSRDEYFSSPEDAEDSLEEGQTLADLKLHILSLIHI